MSRPAWLCCVVALTLVPGVGRAAVLFNEILINPWGSDDTREFVELISTTGADSLTNVWLLEIETDDATLRGRVDMARDLSAAAFGTNGLLLIGHNYGTVNDYGVTNPPTGLFSLSRPGVSTIENDVHLLLATDFTGAVGTDYDADNDGVLDSTPWSALLDSVVLASSDLPEYVPGTRVLIADGLGTVDAVVRFPGTFTANSASAWFGGDMVLDVGPNLFDAGNVTANFPVGAELTPGLPNFTPVPEPAGLALLSLASVAGAFLRWLRGRRWALESRLQPVRGFAPTRTG